MTAATAAKRSEHSCVSFYYFSLYFSLLLRFFFCIFFSFDLFSFLDFRVFCFSSFSFVYGYIYSSAYILLVESPSEKGKK